MPLRLSSNNISQDRRFFLRIPSLLLWAFVLSTSILSFASPGFKEPKLRLGLEINLVTHDLLATARGSSSAAREIPLIVELRSRLLKKMTELCPSCPSDKQTFTMPSGWSIGLDWDPPVIEVNGVISEEFLDTRARELEEILFRAATSIGAFPMPIGAGHLHLDVSEAFGDDPIFFRNFVVEMINNSPTMFALFGGDHNARLYDSARHQQFATVIAQFDLKVSQLLKAIGTIDPIDGRQLIMELAESLNQLIIKFSFLNFSKISKKRFQAGTATLELRCVPEIGSDKDLLSLTRFVKHQLLKTRRKSGLIPVRLLSINESPEATVANFLKMNNGSGLSLNQLKSMVIPEYRPLFPRALSHTCSRLLAPAMGLLEGI
ncbi:MAG: hypothetical protein K2X47_02560 [Bdellovibrionales bacterium]|nr:hypothetical protein [Bdellovibrionales bacterium]